jgi:hypothetical protein
MSRRIRLVLFVLFASLSFGSAACADITAPRAGCTGTQGADC